MNAVKKTLHHNELRHLVCALTLALDVEKGEVARLQRLLREAQARARRAEARADDALARLERHNNGPRLVGGVPQDLVAAYVADMRPQCAFTADQVRAWAATRQLN